MDLFVNALEASTTVDSTATVDPAKEQGAQRVAQQVADDLMSPYCPGRSISSCSSGAARILETEILQEARGGKTRDEIEQMLVARFGEDRVGSSYSAGVVAVALTVSLVAVAVVIRAAQKWQRRTNRSAKPTGAELDRGPSQNEIDRLEDALDDFDEF